MKHANLCNVGEERSTYRTARGVLFFDSIHRVVGVVLDGENYHPADTLNSFEMVGIFTIKSLCFFYLAQFNMAKN